MPTALEHPEVAVLRQALKSENIGVEWLAGDGSDRRYFRITDFAKNTTYVLMQLSGTDAVALKAGSYDWLSIEKILTTHHITCPRPIISLPHHAAIIIEDYGNVMLETAVLRAKDAKIENLYQSCFLMIAKFLEIEQDTSAIWCQRSFDQARFEWELQFFKQKFLVNLLKISFSAEQDDKFARDVQSISHYLAQFSHYFTHRDFHSRNLMVVNDQVAVIDFQDARLGPPAYDLVSLCYDSYVPFEKNDRKNLLEMALQVIGKNSAKTALEIVSQAAPTLLQRQLKAIGSFAYLSLDKNRGNYLKYVVPALETLTEVYDKRWPFLSRELLDLMMDSWAIHLNSLKKV